MGLVDLGKKGVTVASKLAIGAAKLGEETLLTPNAKRQFGYELSPVGWGVFATVGTYGAMARAKDTYDMDRAGIPNGAVGPTPQMPVLDEYSARQAEMLGAGGDLVFAMNNNRRG